MDVSEGVADLHIHTTASDGTCSTSDRIVQARERDLNAVAITDHDTIPEALEERVTSIGGVEVITGVEVRADVRNTKVELLGYYVNPDSDQLMSTLEQAREYRRERNQRIIDQLREETMFDRSYEDIREEVNGIFGRPHIANILIEENIVDSTGTAFDKYLGTNGEAFVPMERVPASVVIDAIQGASGVVSLAHPGRVRTDDIQGLVTDLVANGLDAVEVPYPYDEAPSKGYADVDIEEAASFTEEFDLLQTGGSDCHGPDSGKFRIGQVRVTKEQLNALRKLAIERSAL